MPRLQQNCCNETAITKNCILIGILPNIKDDKNNEFSGQVITKKPTNGFPNCLFISII